MDFPLVRMLKGSIGRSDRVPGTRHPGLHSTRPRVAPDDRIACALALLLLVVSAGCTASRRDHAAPASASLPERYRRSIASLMVPGGTRAFQVTSAGDLYNGAWRVSIEPRAGG